MEKISPQSTARILVMKRFTPIAALLILLLACTLGWHKWQKLVRRQTMTQAAAAVRQTPTGYVPRVFYGRLLEPKEKVLHGTGDPPDTYSNSLAPARPTLIMRYVDLHDDIDKFFRQLQAELNASQVYLIPQIGLSLNEGDGVHRYEASVADGKENAALAHLCTGLKSLDRPLFIRPGYEFNGPWNGYAASSYVPAFRRVADAIHQCLPREAAVIWNWSPDADLDRQEGGAPAEYAAARWQQFYPGDAYVDWWGVNLFSPLSITSPTTREFLAEAKQRRFPVMIAESTLRHASIHDTKAAIDQWFAPYFHLIQTTPEIKAFCYIDWDWRNYPQWAAWGDSRLESNREVLDFYRSQIVPMPWIVRTTDRHAARSILRIESR